MKKLSILWLVLILLFCSGCSETSNSYDLLATTLPVYDFTSALCQGSPLTVGRLVTENVSCLHDYTLKVEQMQMVEAADIIILSGAGLEDFLQDALHEATNILDASEGTHLHDGHADHSNHDHSQDPHIWLSPENAATMVVNICEGLSSAYPNYAKIFETNMHTLISQLSDLQAYGDAQLKNLSCRELITFHDGFAYFAESFNLVILEAIEEESGSEASAAEIIHLIDLVTTYHLPSVFTETNGSTACAGIIAAETGVDIYALDMAMTGDSYFDSMYHNIDTIKEALK